MVKIQLAVEVLLNKVDNKQFIEVWQRSETVKEVSDITKLTVGSAYSKAFRLRKLGIKLKRMTTKNQREARELIELANRLVKE